MLANGDNEDIGEDIQSQRDKAEEEVGEFLEQLKDIFGDEFEDNPIFKDICKNGANSEYLQGLPENERDAIAALFQSKFWRFVKGVGEVINALNKISDDYKVEVKYLARRLKNFPFADDIVYKNYPSIKEMDKTEWLKRYHKLKNVTGEYKNFMKYAKWKKC